jgi:phage terminase large subunit
MEVNKPFAFAFDEKKHLADGLQFNYTLPVCLSFDFNVDPITCLTTQYNEKYIHHIKEFRLTDSNVYELCDSINIFFSKKDVYFKVTGDSSGTNRSALAQGNINYYKVIKDKLRLTDGQMILNSFNPSHQNSYVLTNSLFQNYPELKIDRAGCKFLIDDLRYVEIKDDKSFNNKGDHYKGHLLDCLRYFDWSFLRKFINNSYLYKLNQK